MLRVIDTETCGLQGGIVEVASVDVIDGTITNPLSDLICPDRPISPQAMAIHRITEAMVVGKPRIEDAIGRYQGSAYYVAHNARFDRRMLPEMSGEWICTMTLAQSLWPGRKYGNQALRESLQLEVTPPPGLHAHRALYDCHVTASLLIRIMTFTGWDAPEMVRRMQVQGSTTTFPFGKYRGNKIDDVARRDPGYLKWMLKNIPDLKANLRSALERAVSATDDDLSASP
ncbi:exodeoxyribonuclease X [Erwinia tracheiphila]|uniref:Exodeoxyribonuclease X n=1 Tax=Erwinia tracheiphila TaxID=65700 RepID=A0A0M2KFT6_9GAMM|nr:exodeoxyribonuclease X [Erwinia tracheiphila]AXF78719.1 exodeoxyribonuclease X [Erwinia tracheiphila]EOS93253.1 exodeoxyribonuclease X [Erwinia tracheiphila PSU-1]KKF35806.1 exodeoxyribonuclease X [Erwinia tracheiphila]UIA85701.1 exodeoxyribonuclease X [Erwinia tracheiphila]UIA90086.1 exodeoxyribonuclease X [Erwinia tracheiphila]